MTLIKPNTKLVTHSVSFYSTSDNDQVGLSSDTIGFTTFHRFRESEKVVNPNAFTSDW